MEENTGAERCDVQNPQVNNSDAGAGGVGSEAEAETRDERESLRARVESLRETVSTLRKEMFEEKTLWKREMEEIARLANGRRSDSDASFLGNLQADASDLVLTSPLIRDYEEKITRYQGALAQAQAEKRFNMRRQIAANAYRKRLNEVEKLCREELEKVRETATHLEPLKQMASEWGRPGKSVAEGAAEVPRKKATPNSEGGDYVPSPGRKTQRQEETSGVPVKEIDASLVVDEDASSEIKGKIVLHIGSLPAEVPTICYSAKFE